MKRKHLTDQEFNKFKEYLESDSSIEKITIWLCLMSGARQSEILSITRDSFEFESETLRIDGIKNSKSRRVPIHGLSRCKELVVLMGSRTLGSTMSDANNLVAQRRMIQRWFARAISKVGIEGMSLHCLRHTFALRCYLATNRDIMKTKLLMGHKNLGTTGGYLEYAQVEECRDDVMRAMSVNPTKKEK